jgi:hypothetical protein
LMFVGGAGTGFGLGVEYTGNPESINNITMGNYTLPQVLTMGGPVAFVIGGGMYILGDMVGAWDALAACCGKTKKQHEYSAI